MSCGYHILSLQHKLDAAMSPVVCLNSLIWEGLSTLFSVGLEQSDWQLSSILGCIWRGLTLPWDRTRPWGLPGSLRLNTIDAWGDILWKQSWYLWTHIWLRGSWSGVQVCQASTWPEVFQIKWRLEKVLEAQPGAVIIPLQLVPPLLFSSYFLYCGCTLPIER